VKPVQGYSPSWKALERPIAEERPAPAYAPERGKTSLGADGGAPDRKKRFLGKKTLERR